MTYQENAITAEAILTDSTMLTKRGFTKPGFTDPELRIRQPGSRPSHRRGTTRANPDRRMPPVLVLEDGQEISAEMQEICDFLETSVDRVNSYEELLPFLQRCRPMALVAAMDAIGQDGGNVLMTMACHDPSLPVPLMTDGDAALAGAVDAVVKLWGLAEVVHTALWRSPGTIAEFLCRAGLRGNRLALLPV
jgi:hypothetical protein